MAIDTQSKRFAALAVSVPGVLPNVSGSNADLPEERAALAQVYVTITAGGGGGGASATFLVSPLSISRLFITGRG